MSPPIHPLTQISFSLHPLEYQGQTSLDCFTIVSQDGSQPLVNTLPLLFSCWESPQLCSRTFRYLTVGTSSPMPGITKQLIRSIASVTFCYQNELFGYTIFSSSSFTTDHQYIILKIAHLSNSRLPIMLLQAPISLTHSLGAPKPSSPTFSRPLQHAFCTLNTEDPKPQSFNDTQLIKLLFVIYSLFLYLILCNSDASPPYMLPFHYLFSYQIFLLDDSLLYQTIAKTNVYIYFPQSLYFPPHLFVLSIDIRSTLLNRLNNFALGFNSYLCLTK